jgi:hypothetical protein
MVRVPGLIASVTGSLVIGALAARLVRATRKLSGIDDATHLAYA